MDHYYRKANNFTRANRVAGFCFTAHVPASPFYPQLDYTYCAKNPGVPYPTFVAITNAICQAEFSGIVLNDETNWACPAYESGTWPDMINGGNNFDDTTDSSTWQLQAV
jgi:hypothetical protein